jgi:iron complex transport system ATP-binding protein
MHSLQTQSLTLGYDSAPIVEKLNLSIPAGQITALVGANGCGKSTLLRGISRLLKPRRGDVVLNGADIWKMPTKELAKQLGILPQSPVAPEGLSVYELVAQGRYPHQRWYQQWSEMDEQITLDALAITNMLDFSNRVVDTLSGGQRQRAWIAMTLAQDTDWLLLDEPTTFLDLAYQIEVLDLLYELNATRGKTIVMVLHDLNHAARYAHHIIALQKGQVIAQGAPAEVVSETIVKEVFGITAKVISCPVSGAPLVVPQSERHQRAIIKTELHTVGIVERPVIEMASVFNGNGVKEQLA